MKHSVQHVPAQRQAGEHDPGRGNRRVVYPKAGGAPHQPRRNEDAQRHRDQENLADKKRGGDVGNVSST